MTTQTIQSTDVLDLEREIASQSGTHASDGASRRRDRYKGTLEFRLIFAAAFFVFLLTSAIERAIPRWSAGGEVQQPRKSIIGQAKESASIAAGYAFMG